jgi:hypothetical protein
VLTVLSIVVTALTVGPLCAAYGGRHAAAQSARADKAEDDTAAARRLQLLAEVAASHHRDEARLLRRVLGDSHGEVASP